MKVIGAEVLTSTYNLDIQPACKSRDLREWNKKDWRNSKDVAILIKWSNGTQTILTIPAFTVSDGSSVPFLIKALIPPVGPNMFAAIAHDEIYRNPYIDISCGQADDIYYYLALEHKKLAYAGLRIWNFLNIQNPNYKERVC